MDNYNFFNPSQFPMPFPGFDPSQMPAPGSIPGFSGMPFAPQQQPLYTFDLTGSKGQQAPPQAPASSKQGAQIDTNAAQGAPTGKKAKRKAAKGIKRKQGKAAQAAQAAQHAQAQAPAPGKNMKTDAPPPNAPTAPASARVATRDIVVAPSADSGGVPVPTPSYLAQAQHPPTRLARPRAILVVMDLNGTLLYRPDRRRSHRFVHRPHAGPFMEYLIDTFRVAVWSSARPANVAIMCDVLLAPAHRARLLAEWGRDRFGLSAADYAQRVQVYKRLHAVWADPAIQASHPLAASGGRWDQSNTVLVDDSLEKARSEPHNLLRIPEFFGDAAEVGDILPQVHDFLNELAWQDDVSRYIHANPFTLNPEYKLPA